MKSYLLIPVLLIWYSNVYVSVCLVPPMKEKLISWVEIRDFKIDAIDPSRDLYHGRITTNDPQVTVLDMSLQKSSNFYNPRLSHRLKDCLFEGYMTKPDAAATSQKRSTVRLKFCSGDLAGLIHFDGAVWNVHTEPDQSWIMFTNHMIMNDNSTHETRCGFFPDPEETENIREEEAESISNLVAHSIGEVERKRRSLDQASDKFVEIILVHDYEYYQKYELSEEKVNDRAVEIIHLANAYFSEVQNPKVYLILVDVVIWKTAEEKPADLVHDTVGALLSPFLDWRHDNLDSFLSHDNGIFISGSAYTGSAVGYANLGTLCRESKSGSVMSDHSSTLGVMAGTLAHELGHNFNLGHNPTSVTDECACEQGETPCVMNAAIGRAPVRFTECQLNNIKDRILNGFAPCLNNRPEITFGDPFCGDSFVNQLSEECDCGLADACQDSCCNATTCKLKEEADCSSFDLCCDKSCKIRTEGTVCRKDTSSCDLPEYCNGKTSSCPEDVYIQNGERCKNNDLTSHCYYGQCLTVYDQCLNLFTPEERIEEITDERCWDLNERGTKEFNCGTSETGGNNYQMCSPHDSRCGKLLCASKHEDGLDVSWRPGMGGTKYISLFTDVTCFTVDSYKPFSDSVDDYSYVQDGTWCADESICLGQQCINITNIPGLQICPKRCNGNGLCNSNNNCHCHVGWKPPLCDVPGNGGSIDSGPASETPDTSGASKAILVLFLLIIPILIIVAVVLFVFRRPIKKFANEKYTEHFSTFPASGPENKNRSSSSRAERGYQKGAKGRHDDYSVKQDTTVSNPGPKSAPDQPIPNNKKRLPQASDFEIKFESVLFKPSEDHIITPVGRSTGPPVAASYNSNNVDLAFQNTSTEGRGLPPPPPQSVSLRNFASPN